MHENRANKHISVLYRYGQRYFARELSGIGVEVGQVPFLLQCCACPGITQEKLSLNTGMDKGTTARSIKSLEEAGLVIRKTDLLDRRVNHIFPDGRAFEIRESLYAVIDAFHEILYRGMSPGEIETVGRLLVKMNDNVREHFSKG